MSLAAEQTESGWVIAKPTVGFAPAQPANPQMRIVIDQVLQQSQTSSLQPIVKSSQPTAPFNTEARFAERNDAVSGWRSTNIHNAPATVVQSPGADRAPTLNFAQAVPAQINTQLPMVNGETRGPVLEFRPPTSLKAALDDNGDNGDCRGEFIVGSRPTGGQAEDKPAAIPLPENEKLPELLPANETATQDEVIHHGAVATPIDEEFEVTVQEHGPATAPVKTEPVSVSQKSDVNSGSTPKVVATSPSPPPPLTPQLKNLRTRVRSVLKGYYQKSLNSQDNDPWEVMHGMLAFGIHSRIHQGSERGEYITAVGYLCYNRPCKGQTLLFVNPEGELRAKQGVGLQGHMGQLLAMLAQCHVSPDYPIRVGDRNFTVRDLIEVEKKTCYPKTELTFKLIALSHYIDLNETWVNDQGLEWDIPRLIREEIAQPIRGAACGGTHRLSGLSLAVKARQQSGRPVDGEYARAAEFVKNYQNYAFRLQNKDGSLSTKWFQGAGDESDTDRRVKTTGHILEWLVYSLSDEELRDQRTIRTVNYLANLLYSNFSHEWEVGPVSHATHALLLYDERVFQPFDNEVQTTVSGGSKTPTTGARGSGPRR